MEKHKVKDFSGKTVIITGGAGSIGSELTRQVLSLHPKHLKIIDINESGLFHMQENIKSISNKTTIDYHIADIRDKERLEQILPGTDIVFHAAALKHVPLCESNPFEAIKTNVFGTQNLIDISRRENVEIFLTISTDKAVNPINSMGATKLLAEKLTLNAFQKESGTKFSCIRFGNVLNSVGSVIPIFRKQISAGGPVTITSPDMTRFFMSMNEAVSLVIRAANMMKGGEIFILKMRSVRIIDLAETMIDLLALKYGHQPQDIKINLIGIRPGEKLFEELINHAELNFINETNDMYVINYNNPDISTNKPKLISQQGYNSALMNPINKQELVHILTKELGN